MADGCNVIAFPRRDGRARHDAALSAVVIVSCALRTLGEPARLTDLVRLASCVDPRLDAAAVARVLAGETLADLDGVLPFMLFRRVDLAGEEAWALSPEYRAVTLEAGLAPAGR
ncbi:MAG: hypothetical protein ABS77_10790 [Phenylobacterium sp. SCN 69-14]|mgnify:FL=1|jgi:hypothetical protein|nr:MAG: hypothetical protein ABS77_10790 [Phenylobacterium sp. SCN 69-14]